MADAVAVLAPLGRRRSWVSHRRGTELCVNAFALLEGRTVTGSIVGHQAPAVLIPRILDLQPARPLPGRAHGCVRTR